jgi:hypothetical protein
MSILRPTLLAAAIAASASMTLSTAFAANPFLPGGSSAHPMEGTAKEQAACRPDVRRFCASIKQGSDSGAYLACLKANRSKLSKACLAVLESHGQ